MYIRATEGPAQELLQYSLGDAPASSLEADRRFKRVAALVTEGLKAAKDAIPQLSTTGRTTGKQELLRFMTSLLETYFFPRGHGLVDAQGKILRRSQIGTVAIPVEAEGSRWRFEHRFRLYLNDQIGFRKGGDHQLVRMSSNMRLFTRELHDVTPSRAVLVALHEMTHMMFAMIRRFEHWLGTIGAKGAARLLSQPPGQLRKKTGQRGPAVLPSGGFSPEEFITSYVLERGFKVTAKQLKSGAAQQIFERMTSDVDALAAALRAHLDS